MQRVLTVDDDRSLAGVIGLTLKSQGLDAIQASDGQEALRKAYEEHPDLVILDIMMPRLDGLETCRRLKQISNVPVLIVSALTNERDIVRGFDAGADDYLRKPFSLAELGARVRALLRASQERSISHQRTAIRIGHLEIDPTKRSALLDGRLLDLTATEFRLLLHLAENAGRALPAQQIVDHVWGRGYQPGGGHLKVYICYLRKKLGDDPEKPAYISTVRGVGYSFREP